MALKRYCHGIRGPEWNRERRRSGECPNHGICPPRTVCGFNVVRFSTTAKSNTHALAISECQSHTVSATVSNAETLAKPFHLDDLLQCVKRHRE